MAELKALEGGRWFAEFDAAAWDCQLNAALAAGKLDALLTEAEDNDRSQPLCFL
jgi:hypothetical protein